MNVIIVVTLLLCILQAQYEFLHRAIVNYSDLHNLADDEPVS